MASKQDWSKTKQTSSVANTTNNVTKTIADSMNTTLNYVTTVTNSPAGATAGSSFLPIAVAGGLGLVLLLLVMFLKR